MSTYGAFRRLTARLIARLRPPRPSAREEAVRILDLLESAHERRTRITEEARLRLLASIRAVNAANRPGVITDEVLRMIARDAMRTLSRDLTTGAIRLDPWMRRHAARI